MCVGVERISNASERDREREGESECDEELYLGLALSISLSSACDSAFCPKFQFNCSRLAKVEPVKRVERCIAFFITYTPPFPQSVFYPRVYICGRVRVSCETDNREAVAAAG